MHIVILKSGLDRRGGLEKYTWQLGNDFEKRGHRVTVLTSGKVVQQSNLEVISVASRKSMSLWHVLSFESKCLKWLKKNNPQVVLGLDRNSYQTHYRAGNGVHRTFLERRKQFEGRLRGWTFDLNPLHQMMLKKEKTTFENPKLQVLYTNSHMVKEDVLSHYNIEESKIKVVHNGVEWSKWIESFEEWPKEREKKLLESNMNPNAHQFLFIGHGFKRKGLDLLLDALKSLNRKDWQLSVVGYDTNMTKYRKRVYQLGLEPQVKIWGSQNSIVPFYQMADTLVIPSLYDPFANVTVEALAMGLFVITSEFNGGKEVLNNESGSIVSLLSPDSLRQALSDRINVKKSFEEAFKIRQSIQHLDFSLKLKEMVEDILLTV